ncbi:hypothetical protein Poli38472_006386 [Pythium oligandrum]|uniref:Mechanosensitive ion channel MscS domain-containing protein n=1 Tax=Pythium oligandrum TaxID=41045 RepID=A0A8K1C4I0_PYTOL|nr:hypothetical protein Poli38472_006386 [Pythium oligandrum]|eukprot:TMW56376.1 hypothetical protein Poli38472_006386 [Pythium oligandrum]
MISLWRIGLAALAALGAYFLTQPVMEMLFNAVLRRTGKRYRWVGDIKRYLLGYLSWICFMGLLMLIVKYILEIDEKNDVSQAVVYVMAVPVVLGTFALRKVLTNFFIRRYKWDRGVHEADTKIFVVTEAIKFVCFALILVEIFYIFFASQSMAKFLLLEVFLGLEITLLLSGYTTLKNVSTGLFLIYAEPFRTGSFCRILNYYGMIERVSLARTILRRQDGSRVFVPNGVFADWQQTHENPTDAFFHELTIQLPTSTYSQDIRFLREDLFEMLAEYAAMVSDDLGRRASVYSSGDSVMTQSGARHSVSGGYRQSSVSSVDPRLPRKALQVTLSQLYRIKISMTIDRELFTSLEAAKTEINLAIITVCEKNEILPVTMK